MREAFEWSMAEDCETVTIDKDDINLVLIMAQVGIAYTYEQENKE